MAKYATTDWRMRRTTKANTFVKTENVDGSFSHLPVEGTILEEGTPINETNMDNIEEGIYNANQKLDNNGADEPITDLAGYDNLQDMLSNINANVYKAHARIDVDETVINFPAPISKFWLLRYSAHGNPQLIAINGIDVTTSSWTSRHNVVHQSFGSGLNSMSYSSNLLTGYGLKMFSTWLMSENVSDSVPPATTTWGDSTDTTSEGYFYNRNHAAVADNKMSIHCTGRSSDNVGAHTSKGMSYFSSVIYSNVVDSFIENITSMTFTGGGYINIEILQAPSFAALDNATNIMEEYNTVSDNMEVK